MYINVLKFKNFSALVPHLNALACPFRFFYGTVMVLLYDFKCETIHFYSYSLVIILVIR